MSKYLDNLQPWAILFVRLTLGTAMLYNGWHKVIPAGGFHGSNIFSALQHWNAFVLHLGMPAWLGTVSALTEFLGGVALLLGLLTRFFAFLVAINMAVAVAKVNVHHGYDGSQYSLALIALALALLSFGSGTLAMDRRIGLA